MFNNLISLTERFPPSSHTVLSSFSELHAKTCAHAYTSYVSDSLRAVFFARCVCHACAVTVGKYQQGFRSSSILDGASALSLAALRVWTPRGRNLQRHDRLWFIKRAASAVTIPATAILSLRTTRQEVLNGFTLCLFYIALTSSMHFCFHTVFTFGFGRGEKIVQKEKKQKKQRLMKKEMNVVFLP